MTSGDSITDILTDARRDENERLRERIAALESALEVYGTELIAQEKHNLYRCLVCKQTSDRPGLIKHLDFCAIPRARRALGTAKETKNEQ